MGRHDFIASFSSRHFTTCSLHQGKQLQYLSLCRTTLVFYFVFKLQKLRSLEVSFGKPNTEKYLLKRTLHVNLDRKAWIRQIFYNTNCKFSNCNSSISCCFAKKPSFLHWSKEETQKFLTKKPPIFLVIILQCSNQRETHEYT